ncbi:BON domain-containing protein [Paraburkholderia oxyphila]|uniref:BON domain-containing protein n=1 Tax=Paraburkholderia oxyphila TaxID=614212 RepID=UPI000A05C728|nr:BON domain-containing protein [Paraburkholderia oxyphila]
MRTSLCLLTLVYCGLFSTYDAFAQANEPQASAPEATMSRKEMRAENRQTVRSVRHALLHTKGLDASGIRIKAKDGVVLLAGTVPDASQIPLAVAAAASAPTVKSVSNYISVRIPGGR